MGNAFMKKHKIPGSELCGDDNSQNPEPTPSNDPTEEPIDDWNDEPDTTEPSNYPTGTPYPTEPPSVNYDDASMYPTMYPSEYDDGGNDYPTMYPSYEWEEPEYYYYEESVCDRIILPTAELKEMCERMHGEYQTDVAICNVEDMQAPQGTNTAIFSHCCLFKCKMFDGKQDLCNLHNDPAHYHRCVYHTANETCADTFDNYDYNGDDWWDTGDWTDDQDYNYTDPATGEWDDFNDPATGEWDDFTDTPQDLTLTVQDDMGTYMPVTQPVENGPAADNNGD